MRTQRRGLLLGTAAVAAAAHSTRLSEIVACARSRALPSSPRRQETPVGAITGRCC
jgi:hypothetical protein